MEMNDSAEKVGETILSTERGALDRWGKGDISGVIEVCANALTYFDPLTATRLDGRRALEDYLAPWAGKIRIPRYEIRNPQVIVDGKLALLSYNLVNYIQNADGSEAIGSRWNSTQVYRRIEGQWKIIHSHWSFTAHPAFQNMSPEATEGMQT